MYIYIYIYIYCALSPGTLASVHSRLIPCTWDMACCGVVRCLIMSPDEL